MSRLIEHKTDAKSYGLGEQLIPIQQTFPKYGQIMIASEQSKGGLMMIDESKGKRIIGISGGAKKLFIFQEQNQSENVVTALHPEHDDYLQYKGQQILPIHEIVLGLQGNKIKEIKSGKEHNIIMTEQGTLYAVGKGNFGSLGLGGTVFSAGPKLINKLSNKKVVSIACGMFHTLALSNIGDVYSWGRGFEGQLGLLQNIQSVSSPQYISNFFKYNNDKDVKTLQKTSIISIACGSYHSIAIDKQNNIYCWGQARYGQTGNGKKSKEPVPIKISVKLNGEQKKIIKADGGFGHTLCLTSEGQIFSWGLNIKGQLGLNDLPENIRSSSEGHLNYIKAADKPMHVKQARDKTLLPKFKEISCGFTSSYAIDENGRAWSWGGGYMGFKDKFLQRGPVQIKQMTDNKSFTKIFANNNSMILFCPLSPLYFKPTLVPSKGKTEITFFGNGFVNTGSQTVRFTLDDDQVQVDLSFDPKTNTFFCQAPVFEKMAKKYSYPLACKVEVSLDKKQYLQYPKSLLIYSSKLQIQNIEPNCGSVLGGSTVKLYMPIPEKILEYVQNITVGFKNNQVVQQKQSQKDTKIQNNQDWLCTQGTYQNETVVCKIPNIPHFNLDHPFYMLDVSLNGQDFTQLPHTFRYYFISETKIDPYQGLDDDQPECKIQGQGLFDTPKKQLKVSLDFTFNENRYTCERKVDLKWSKTDRQFIFKMPKLSWIIGDHQITPQLLEEARKHPCVISLFVAKKEFIQIGKYTFVVPPPPPQPVEEKKDAKKGAKK